MNDYYKITFNRQEIYIREDLLGTVSPTHYFDYIMELSGIEVRKAPGRTTIRCILNESPYYLKKHTGVTWKEIFKNLLYLKMPVLGAITEWNGIRHLNRLGIPTLTAAGYGKTSSKNPTKLRSFIITDEISDTVNLENIANHLKNNASFYPDSIRLKRWLIRKVAEITRDMHHSGANHRDLYLCHFLLKRNYTNGIFNTEESVLYLIDLHRMKIRNRTPSRWLTKDIAGLYFSSKDIGLTERDRFRFMMSYRSCSLKETITRDYLFWKWVTHRGNTLYKSINRKQRQHSIEI